MEEENSGALPSPRLDKKHHNPNYTVAAVNYLNEYVTVRNKFLKEKKLETLEQRKAFINSFDWWRMTEQDNDVWDKIFATLEK